MPVILIQYDARNDKAYWLHVQEHCKTAAAPNLFGASKQITLSIARENVLNYDAMKRLARKKNDLVQALARGGYRADE